MKLLFPGNKTEKQQWIEYLNNNRQRDDYFAFVL